METKNRIISQSVSLLEALKLMDSTGFKSLLVLDKSNKFKGILSIGDIQRALINDNKLDISIKEILRSNPRIASIGTPFEKIKADMVKYRMEFMPVINADNEIKKIYFWEELFDIKTNIPLEQFNVPVVIMAGGLGTRLYPYTKILPKPLIPVGEIPITEHIINRFNDFGCKKFFMIVNHKKNMIKAYFNEIEKDYDIAFIDENKPLGTGGGLSLLKGKINSTFVLSNCDIFIDEDIEKIYSLHKSEKNYVTMVCSLKKFTIPYGVIEINGQGEINKMQEKPEFTFFTNTGMYIVEPDVLDAIEKDQEIDFPDIIERARIEGKRIGVFPISEDSWIDIGQLEGMEEMQKRLSERI